MMLLLDSIIYLRQPSEEGKTSESNKLRPRLLMKVRKIYYLKSKIDIESKLKSMLTQVAQGQEPARPQIDTS